MDESRFFSLTLAIGLGLTIFAARYESSNLPVPTVAEYEVPFSKVDSFIVHHGPYAIPWVKQYSIPLSDTTINVFKNKISNLELTCNDTILVSKDSNDHYHFSKK